MKQCNSCLQLLDPGAFGEDRRSTDNLATSCIECVGKRGVQRLVEHEQMYVRQGMRCAICNCKVLLAKIKVDYDYTTQKVHSLLCDRCTKLLKGADRDLRVLRAAVRYLETSPPPPCKPDPITTPM